MPKDWTRWLTEEERATMTRLARMQVGCPSSIPNDWATEKRNRGEPIPSAHICLGWAEDEINPLLRSLAALRALVAEKDKALKAAEDWCKHHAADYNAMPMINFKPMPKMLRRALALTEEEMLKRLEGGN